MTMRPSSVQRKYNVRLVSGLPIEPIEGFDQPLRDNRSKEILPDGEYLMLGEKFSLDFTRTRWARMRILIINRLDDELVVEKYVMGGFFDSLCAMTWHVGEEVGGTPPRVTPIVPNFYDHSWNNGVRNRFMMLTGVRLPKRGEEVACDLFYSAGHFALKSRVTGYTLSLEGRIARQAERIMAV
jgi:hypothetical protein